ncbi:lipoate-protein ligase A [Tamaricihabitans halophyticus]|uniref:Lipoate-protein ligase A n=1 Tax=Tamaricihabitans halophyticus TaxID=1262583 RepID=A0A4R2R3F0_9PSEU|nr:lipoate-protein ligase A [Tamaricihabitans halophyticus]
MFSVVAAQDDSARHDSAWRNLAFDEALLRAKPQSPVLWLWRNPQCVVLGRGQRAEREVDFSACSADGVPVLRRGSGGGTVYHDRGNLNITLVQPGAVEPLELLGTALSTLVSELGLSPRLTKRGLFIGADKLCGFAALRTKEGVLAHSTLLVSSNPELVTRYLTPTPEQAHPLDSERSPVTTLAAHGIGGYPDNLVIDAMSRELGTAIHRGPNEAELAQEQLLMHSRYGFSPWHLSGRARQLTAAPS